jgi:hypothetical protein
MIHRLMNPGSNGYGHLFVSLYRGDGIKRKRYVHQLVLDAFVGACPEGMECRHLDNNPSNNDVSNLAWGTKKENEADKIGNNTTNRGSRNGMAKLTEAQVEEIRKRYASGNVTQESIGLEFGVSGGTVCRIVNLKGYKHPAFAIPRPPKPEPARDRA